MKEFLRCCIEIASPVHIGCDEVYEPTGFVVDEEREQLIVFDPADFFAELDDRSRAKFSEICQKGTISSLLEIYKFLRGRPLGGKSVSICSGFLGHYEKTLGLPLGNEYKIRQELNRFTISRTSFLSFDGRPYLPGSAIKGAIRTAYLNAQAKTHNLGTPTGRGGHKELERALLDGGSFDTDPFRLVKVSDFIPVGEIRTRIMYAVNEKKKLSTFEPRGPYQIVEVIEPGARFQGSITLDDRPKGSKMATTIDRDALIESIGQFYAGEKNRENTELAAIGLEGPLFSADNSLALLRVGRHSGAESLTIEGHRHIRIMQGRGEQSKTMDHATTLWLASEHSNPVDRKKLKPFGWSLLKGLASDQIVEFQETEALWREQVLRKGVGRQSESGSRASTVQQVQAKPPETEMWEAASLTWNPGRSLLEITSGNKKATASGKDLVPESLHNKLFNKKKAVKARVTVEVVSTQYFKVIKIDPIP